MLRCHGPTHGFFPVPDRAAVYRLIGQDVEAIDRDRVMPDR